MPTGVYKRTYPSNLMHGHRREGQRTPTYTTWGNMLKRCRNPNATGYKNYGGRGIKVCKRWLKFEDFLSDMGERPKDLVIERIDNDGNYEPKNCKWATRKEQSRNKRPRKLTDTDVLLIRVLYGEVRGRDLAKRFKVSFQMISHIQLRKKWKHI